MIFIGEIIFGIPLGAASTFAITRAVEDTTTKDIGIVVMWVLATTFALVIALRQQPSQRPKQPLVVDDAPISVANTAGSDEIPEAFASDLRVAFKVSGERSFL